MVGFVWVELGEAGGGRGVWGEGDGVGGQDGWRGWSCMFD